MSETRPPSAQAVALMQVWPADGWLSERQLVDALRANGVPVVQARGTYRYAGRPLGALLGESRRRSWLLRDQHTPEYMYKRTTKGSQAGEDR